MPRPVSVRYTLERQDSVSLWCYIYVTFAKNQITHLRSCSFHEELPTSSVPGRASDLLHVEHHPSSRELLHHCFVYHLDSGL